MQRLCHRSHLHTFVKDRGYVLGNGAASVLETWLWDTYAPYAVSLAPSLLVSVDTLETHVKLLPFAFTEYNLTQEHRETLESHISSVLCFILFQSCAIAKMHGRAKVYPTDVLFLCQFSDAMWILRGGQRLASSLLAESPPPAPAAQDS